MPFGIDDIAMLAAGAGGLASIFSGGTRRPTWSEREMGGTSARLMRGAGSLEAGRIASLADLFGGTQSAIDTLTQMYGPNPTYTPSPLLGPIREGLYGAFDPSTVRSSPLYKAASDNILLNRGEAARRIASEVGSRTGGLESGGYVGSLENLERGTTGLLNTAFMNVADVQREERTNRINMALKLLTGNVAGGASNMAATAGSMAFTPPTTTPSAGSGLSTLATQLMLRQYLAGMNQGRNYRAPLSMGDLGPIDATRPGFYPSYMPVGDQ